MNTRFYSLLLSAIGVSMLTLASCDYFCSEPVKVRHQQDTTRYASRGPQMDEVLKTVYRQQDTIRNLLQNAGFTSDSKFKLSIVPNDNYANAGYFYPMTLFNLRCPTIIVIGPSEKASLMGIENKLIFGSYSHWIGPYDSIKISDLRDELKNNLSGEWYTVNDSLMKIETSIEAVLPYIQHIDRDVQIVPILVAPMELERMKKVAQSLGQTLHQFKKPEQWKWGREFGIAISSNGVHYEKGSFAPFGTDSVGYQKATSKDKQLARLLTKGMTPTIAQKFMEATSKPQSWNWNGRYVVPLGLLTGHALSKHRGLSLEGHFLNYTTSRELAPLPFDQYQLTARQDDLTHWMGYVGIIYK